MRRPSGTAQRRVREPRRGDEFERFGRARRGRRSARGGPSRQHSILGERLTTCTAAINASTVNPVETAVPNPDHLKFHSSATLFERAARCAYRALRIGNPHGAGPIFRWSRRRADARAAGSIRGVTAAHCTRLAPRRSARRGAGRTLRRHGINTVEPVVRRASRSRCARAASVSGYRCPIRTRSTPFLTAANNSRAAASSCSRLAM